VVHAHLYLASYATDQESRTVPRCECATIQMRVPDRWGLSSVGAVDTSRAQGRGRFTAGTVPPPNRPQYSKTGHGGAIATVDGYGHCSATSSAVWWRNRAARDPFGFRPMKTTWDQGLVNYGTRLASGEPGVKPRERRVIRCDSLSFMKQDSR